eukprot:3329060-Pleurochrysis_carterae.AAC.1
MELREDEKRRTARTRGGTGVCDLKRYVAWRRRTARKQLRSQERLAAVCHTRTLAKDTWNNRTRQPFRLEDQSKDHGEARSSSGATNTVGVVERTERLRSYLDGGHGLVRKQRSLVQLGTRAQESESGKNTK